MKYQVGDRVRIRKDLTEDTRYYMENSSVFWIAIDSMVKLVGEIVTIRDLRWEGDGYYINESVCIWTDGMFEPMEDEQIIDINDLI